MARNRRRAFGLADQVGYLIPLFVCWAGAAALLVTVASRDQEQQAGMLLAPVTVGRLPWYTGVVGSLGVLAWAVGATAAAAGALVARLGGRARAARFLGQTAAYTFVLAVDDMFELHAQLLPRALGIPKSLVLVGLLGAMPVLLLANRREVLRTRTFVLAASAAALASALVVDFAGRGSPRELLIEESAQFLGVVAWAVWLSVTSFDVIVSVVRRGELGLGRTSAESGEDRLRLFVDQEQDRRAAVGGPVTHG